MPACSTRSKRWSVPSSRHASPCDRRRHAATDAAFLLFDASRNVVQPGRHMTDDRTTDLKATVREKYGQAALRVAEGNTAGCCGGSSGCCGATTEAWDPITSQLYDEGQTADIPAEALLASLGCGNPTMLAELREGETVLDLGSGGGIDVLLSAKRVGPAGKAYGLDMTDEMLHLARENQRKAGV